jgi:uncharacterized protein YceH (UPF0502 family)
MLKRLGTIVALILVTVTLTIALGWGLQTRATAQATVNLQADVNQLRQQVAQLQAQVSQLNRRLGAGTAAPTTPRSQRSPELSDQQIVDRLAVLAIEAKDRLTALERRVSVLEKR